MIDILLKWARLARPRPLHTRSLRPARTIHRPLAMEPVENRLLLTATCVEAVADGGTVELVYAPAGWATEGVHDQQQQSASDVSALPDQGNNHLDHDFTVRRTEQAESDGPLTVAGKPFSSTQAHGQLNTTITPPKSQELTPDELPQKELDASKTETGLADVTLVAHQTIFAQIESINVKRDRNDLLDNPANLQLARDISPTADMEFLDASHEPAEHLAGSRGRLAAFDLALQEDAADLPLNINAAEQNENLGKSHVPTEKTHSSQPSSEISAGLDCPDNATPELSPPVHDLALAEITDSQAIARLALNETTTCDQQEQEQHTSITIPITSDPNINPRVVNLDQKQARPVVNLAAVVGAACLFSGNRQRAPEDSEHEQRPPREKRKRHE